MSPPAMAMLARETRLHETETPAVLADATLTTPLFSFAPGAFLLALPGGLRFHYRQGEGVAFSRPEGMSDATVTLFHSGSVYGAVAWLNGLVPLHASAVVHEGRVHAFTGDSGAGKSTLAAALSQQGLPLFSDDVLVLDLSDPACPMALPGHKRLKLWQNSLELTGLNGDEPVRAEIDKYFVEPPLKLQEAPLPLHQLYFLDQPSGRDASIATLSGAARFSRARAAFYRPRYCSAVVQPTQIFTMATRVASRVSMNIFDRPLAPESFSTNVAFMADVIRNTPA